jgi:DNA-binding transcriptional MerR regulator
LNCVPLPGHPKGPKKPGDEVASYTIADAQRLLKVKAHVIRYWEQEIPLLQPEKDTNGRKLYSSRDLQILLRLKYLLYGRRFTLEGAREQLYHELAGDYQDLRGNISALRSELLDLYFKVTPAQRSGEAEDDESF